MKILIVISVILIVVGLVIGFIALASSGFDLSKSEKIITESFTVTDDIKSVEIDTGSAGLDVIIRKGEEVSARLDIVRKEVHSVEYSVSEGKLIVNANKAKNFLYNIFNFAEKTGLTLTLPEKIYESFTVNTSSGDIRLSGFDLSGELNLDTSSGDINLANVSAASLSVSVASGDVKINRFMTKGDVSIHATSGDVSLDGIGAKALTISGSSSEVDVNKATLESVNIDTSAGDIELNETYTTGAVKIDTTAGEIDIERSNFAGKLTIKSTSGDIHVTSSDAAELDLDSTSGDVTLRLLSAKNFITDTSSGRVDVIGTVYTAPLCKVSTTSGDISIRIAE